MAQHGRPYSARKAHQTSRRVRESTVGSHVSREAREVRRRDEAVEAIRRRAQVRRAVAGIVGVAIVVAAGLIAAFLAFRGTVDSSMALRDSDAQSALVAAEAEAPYYMLVSVELGAVAEPLRNEGPDVLMLARIDNANGSLALIGIPSDLQVSSDGRSTTVAALAQQGDAKLIGAIAQFTKLDISHYLKIDEDGLVGIVDGLGGIPITLDQVIDDPQAGDVYLPAGDVTLNGATALQYLRSQNVKLGRQDQMSHQLQFATAVLTRLFAGNYSANIDAIDQFLQTDLVLADLEAIGAWLPSKQPTDIVVTSLPGYVSAATTVNANDSRYIGSYEEFAQLIEMLDQGQKPPSDTTDGIVAAEPSTVTVDIQNGTTITGAASTTADQLKAAGFKIGEVGNAEQQVYTETLVIYKDDHIDQAKAVIEALGVGRAVNAGVYYEFTGNVLVIIGSDFSPIS